MSYQVHFHAHVCEFSKTKLTNLGACFNPGVENRPVITYAHPSQVDRVA